MYNFVHLYDIQIVHPTPQRFKSLHSVNDS